MDTKPRRSVRALSMSTLYPEGQKKKGEVYDQRKANDCLGTAVAISFLLMFALSSCPAFHRISSMIRRMSRPVGSFLLWACRRILGRAGEKHPLFLSGKSADGIVEQRQPWWRHFCCSRGKTYAPGKRSLSCLCWWAAFYDCHHGDRQLLHFLALWACLPIRSQCPGGGYDWFNLVKESSPQS